MNLQTLLAGYKEIVSTIYAPKQYYQRIRNFLMEYCVPKGGGTRLSWTNIMAFLKANLRLGLLGRERVQYWKLFFWSLLRRPRLFPLAVTLSIYGFHYRKVFENYLTDEI
jgi:hypothetical protein